MKQNRLMKTAAYAVLISFVFMMSGNLSNSAGVQSSGIAYAAAASARNKDCANCEKKEKGRAEGALCSLKFIVYFLWFSFLAVAGVLIVVMDLVTGFSQGYTGDFSAWLMEKTDSLHRFFRALGCG